MIVLDHLTVWELAPPELISCAADAGYDSVSLWFHTPPDGLVPFPMKIGAPLLRECSARTRDLNVAIHSVGLFILTSEGWNPEWDAMLDSGAQLGAVRALVLILETERSRAQALLSRLAERAADRGIGVDLEFIAGTGMPSFGDAHDLARSIGNGCGVVLDALHLQRTGGIPADLQPADWAMVRYVQLCDGPAMLAPDKWFEEATRNRMLPGKGEFPLLELAAAVPPGVPIGIEVPLQGPAAKGLGAVERARKALEAARPFVNLSAEARSPDKVRDGQSCG